MGENNPMLAKIDSAVIKVKFNARNFKPKVKPSIITSSTIGTTSPRSKTPITVETKPQKVTVTGG